MDLSFRSFGAVLLVPAVEGRLSVPYDLGNFRHTRQRKVDMSHCGRFDASVPQSGKGSPESSVALYRAYPVSRNGFSLAGTVPKDETVLVPAFAEPKPPPGVLLLRPLVSGKPERAELLDECPREIVAIARRIDVVGKRARRIV